MSVFKGFSPSFLLHPAWYLKSKASFTVKKKDYDYPSTAILKWKVLILLAFLLLDSGIIQAQETASDQETVSGVVKDAAGEALIGVSVKIKGTSQGTSTDANGRFTIAVPNKETILTFSYVGFSTVELKADKSTLNVVLQLGKELEEVVVIGYGAVRKSEVTSSISSVTAQDIKDLPQAGVDQMLQGKVSGVTVTNNGGQPGGGVSVLIRGITTINSNEPLYVVDGVILDAGSTNTIGFDQLGGERGQTSQSAIASINPNDIESIDILKDASAQAIYGSRAANGVVIITTKRGKAGDSKVLYEGYYGVQQVPNRLDLMNLSQFAAYNNSVLREVGQVLNTNVIPIPEFQRPEVLGEGTNWQDAIYKSGAIQNHQLAFSGGQESTTYYLSMNYFDQEGTIIGSDYDRYSMRFNLDHQVKDWLKIGMSTNVSRSNQRISLTNGTEGIVNLAVQNSPAAPITSPNGEYATTISVGGYNFGNNMNPVARASLREVRKLHNKATSNIYGEIIFNKHFKLRNEFNFDYNHIENMAFQPSIITSRGLVITSPSHLLEQRNASLYLSLVNYLSYNQQFGKHAVSAQIGHEAQQTQSNNINGSRRNLALNFPSLAAGAQDGQTLGGGKYDWAMESYFARAGYTYDDRYAINFSLRRDGSSTFGPDNRIGYFPAVSAGWTVTNESFAENWKKVNYLKFRLGAGAVGNQSAGSNNFATIIRLFATGPFGAGGIPDNIGNPSLGWESDVNYNAGIDIGLLDQRLELSLDAYHKETSNMLLITELPVFTGIGANWDDIKAPWVNVGNMQNRGIDLSITSYNMVKQDFNWKTNVIFSHYKNRLNSLNNENADIWRYAEYGNAVPLTRTLPGGPVGRFYGFVTDGLFGSVAEIQNSAYQGLTVGPTGTWVGDVKYRDLNSDGVIDDQDITFIGDPNPDFTYGITNTFQYKGFDLSVFLQGSYGGDILHYARRTSEGMRNPHFNQLTNVMNRYSADNPEGNLPRYNQWHNDNWRVSDRFIEDGSYLRIQNITLGYNLPFDIIKKAKMRQARIYATIQNLYTFTQYTGMDPELGAFDSDALQRNVDQGNYPNPRTFNFGVNVTF